MAGGVPPQWQSLAEHSKTQSAAPPRSFVLGRGLGETQPTVRCIWSRGGVPEVRVGDLHEESPNLCDSATTESSRKLQTSTGHVGLSSQHLGGSGKENQDFRANILGYILSSRPAGLYETLSKKKNKFQTTSYPLCRTPPLPSLLP